MVEQMKRQLAIDAVSSVSLSPQQDDFVVLHVTNEYDTVFESVFKTEFLTLLSEKYTAQTRKTLVVSFGKSITFTVKKEGFGGGGTRIIQFSQGQGEAAVMKVSGKTLQVSIGAGLPASTKPSHQRAAASKGKAPPAGTKQGGDKPTITTKPAGIAVSKAQTQQPSKGNTAKSGAPKADLVDRKDSSLGKNKQPHLNPTGARGKAKRESSSDYSKAEFMKTPEGGGVRPPPAQRKKPPPAPKPQLPLCKALYDYDASDADELNFKEGDIIEILTEDPTGWWKGRLKGKEGVFPNNYIEKM